MSEIDDGGPAFPTPSPTLPIGMSLRDYFAACALQGWAAGRNAAMDSTDPRFVSQSCYLFADAMLRARK
jgi:hypothetical protein